MTTFRTPFSHPGRRTLAIRRKSSRLSPTMHHEWLILHFVTDRGHNTRMFQARAQLVLAVAPDEDDDERAHTESEGRAETDGDLEEGRRKAGVPDSGIVVVERDVVEGGLGDGVIGWKISDVKVRGGGRASDCAGWGRRRTIHGSAVD